MDKEKEEIIDLQVEEMIGSQSTEDKSAFKKILLDVISNGKTVMEAIGFPKGTLEVMYSYGLELYGAKKYEEALPLFFMICQLNPKEPRYMFSAAATMHMTKRYLEAVTYYMIANSLDETNPIYQFHAADCFIKMGQPDTARVLLWRASDLAEDRPEYAKIKQQALAMHDVIVEALEKRDDAADADENSQD